MKVSVTKQQPSNFIRWEDLVPGDMVGMDGSFDVFLVSNRVIQNSISYQLIAFRHGSIPTVYTKVDQLPVTDKFFRLSGVKIEVSSE